MQKEKIIEVKNLKKSFKDVNPELIIFENINFEIFSGEKIAILGSSGSGKSTFLSILAGLDRADFGEIKVLNQEINNLSFEELASYRNKKISIIFQSFELISPFSVIENVSVPLKIKGTLGKKQTNEISQKLLEEVGLKDRMNAFPNTLSGGERQRVAIARTLASNTPIILADEPTGSLDVKTGENILNLLLQEVEKRKKTLIVITHDLKIAEKMDRIFELKDKNLYERNKKS